MVALRAPDSVASCSTACSVAPRLSRNAGSMGQRLSRSSLCTCSHDEDAIARAASLDRAEPAPGSQMFDDGDGDGGGDDGAGDGDGHDDGEMMV